MVESWQPLSVVRKQHSSPLDPSLLMGFSTKNLDDEKIPRGSFEYKMGGSWSLLGLLRC